MDDYHVPVLLKEALWFLDVKPGRKYIDCTLGGGGHSRAILDKGGRLLAIDQDQEAIEHFASHRSAVLKKGNFAHLKEIVIEAGFKKVAGILFDLGVSSHQLETDYRGFSFNLGGDLDMRMDQMSQAVTAGDLVNAGSEEELANLFWKFGEERDSRRIAKEIVKVRKNGPIGTTNQLAEIVLRASHRGRSDRTHPATRVFQALRMAVNDELSSLEAALPQAEELLETKGRLVVISFHSLEDRVVKKFMRRMATITAKPITPSREEVAENPRSRSGKLRAFEKI